MEHQEQHLFIFDRTPLHTLTLGWLSARALVPLAAACKTWYEVLQCRSFGVIELNVQHILSRYACLSRELLSYSRCWLEGLAVLEAAAEFMDTISGHYAFSSEAGLFIAPNGVFENYRNGALHSHNLIGALTIRGGNYQSIPGLNSACTKEWWWYFDRWYVECKVNGKLLTTKEELHEYMPHGDGDWLDDDLRCFCLDALRASPSCRPRAREQLRVGPNGFPYTEAEFAEMKSLFTWNHAHAYRRRTETPVRECQSLEDPAWVTTEYLPPSLVAPPGTSSMLGRVLYWQADGPCIVALAETYGDYWIQEKYLRKTDGPPLFMESDKKLTATCGWNLDSNIPRAIVPRHLSWGQVPDVHRTKLLASSRGIGPSPSKFPPISV